MYVLSNKSGPVVVLSNKDEAQSWSERFGWSVQEVPSGDEISPMKLVSGFMNLLEPSKRAVLKEPFVSFLPEEQNNFVNGDTIEEGAEFYKSNLENFFFSIPEDKNPNELALGFWQKLHSRGLDLRRQVGDKFVVVRTKEVSVESPRVIELSAGSNIGPTDTAVVKKDARLMVPTLPSVDPKTTPLKPGEIRENINGNVI